MTRSRTGDTLGALPTQSAIACMTLVAALFVAVAAGDDTIRVWKVGSPHTDRTPDVTIPPRLSREAARQGMHITVEAFPARGFAAVFRDAVAQNAVPDILEFDNFGVMDGITTRLGSFTGVGEDPQLRQHFVRVTGTFDELLGPQRGWTYLSALSSNHEAARRLALMAPECLSRAAGPSGPADLMAIVPGLTTAYLRRDEAVLQASADPDRIPPTGPEREALDARAVQPCGVWGGEKLAFVWVNASYESETTIGQTPVLLVLRKPAFHWQLLVAARDPISTGAFKKDVASASRRLFGSARSASTPLAATLLSPRPGDEVRPARGQRFGSFSWKSSLSEDVVAEIAEFTYDDDARLLLTGPARPGSVRSISAGKLWTSRSVWSWRIWSLSKTGDVTFSETRTFLQPRPK